MSLVNLLLIPEFNTTSHFESWSVFLSYGVFPYLFGIFLLNIIGFSIKVQNKDLQKSFASKSNIFKLEKYV
jgi:hypothetical protein